MGVFFFCDIILQESGDNMKISKRKAMGTLLGVFIACTLTLVLRDVMIQEQAFQENKNLLRLQQASTQAISSMEGNKDSIRSSHVSYPKAGDSYAVIYNEERGFSKDLYFGDDESILNISIGQYKKSGIPGQGKPLLVAGHNGTHFKALPSFEIGDMVGIETSYGTYTYEVYDMQTILAEDFDTTQLEKEEEYLIMYTCYPFNVAVTNQRYFVYAKKITGPVIEEDGTWKN